jgi:hypothetical protein
MPFFLPEKGPGCYAGGVWGFQFSAKIGEAERQWNFSGRLLISLRLSQDQEKFGRAGTALRSQDPDS